MRKIVTLHRFKLPRSFWIISSSLERAYVLLSKSSKIFNFEWVVVILSLREEGMWTPKWINIMTKASQTVKIESKSSHIGLILMVYADIKVIEQSEPGHCASGGIRIPPADLRSFWAVTMSSCLPLEAEQVDDYSRQFASDFAISELLELETPSLN